MVQTATLQYSNMPNGHYSSLIMGYPQQSATSFYQDNSMSRIYNRRDSSSQGYSSRSTNQSQQAAWNPQQQQQHQHQQQQQQQQHQSQHQHHHQQQQQQQQQQQPQSQPSPNSTLPTSSPQSLPPLAEALHRIFPTPQQSTQTQAIQSRTSTQQQQQQQPDNSMAIQQAQQAQQAQAQQAQAQQSQAQAQQAYNVASAYQQGMQYSDVSSSYVIPDVAAYSSPATTQIAQQIVSQASAGLSPIVPSNTSSDISSGIMVNSSPSMPISRHGRQGSSSQMMSLSSSMLPVAQDPSSASQLAVTSVQSTSSALQYSQYPTPIHHHQQMLTNPATAVYGPPSSAIGHRRNHSTSSTVSTSSTQHDDDANSSSGEHQKVFSFVALPGVNTKKRPRRKYEEIERHYACSFPGCNKSYGTLNHLNAHVQMQKHGQKRHPSEFKELRKQWRRQKREEAIKKAAEDHNMQH